MESQAVFQAKTQAKIFLLNRPPEEEEEDGEEDDADPSIATYRVKRPCYGGGYYKLRKWKKCYPKQEVSDHRPRKLVLPK